MLPGILIGPKDVVVEGDLGGLGVPLPERIMIGGRAGVGGIHRLQPQQGIFHHDEVSAAISGIGTLPAPGSRANAVIAAVEEGIFYRAAIQRIILDAVVAHVFEVHAPNGPVHPPRVHADPIAAVKDPRVFEMQERLHGFDMYPSNPVHRTPSSGGRLLS